MAYHIPVKSKVNSETMADVATDLLKQNGRGEGARGLYLSNVPTAAAGIARSTGIVW